LEKELLNTHRAEATNTISLRHKPFQEKDLGACFNKKKQQ
jgi:hypothetical protein